MKTPEDSLDSLSFQNTNRNNIMSSNSYDQSNNPYMSVGPPSIPHQNVGVQHWPPIQHQNAQKISQSTSPLQRSAA